MSEHPTDPEAMSGDDPTRDDDPSRDDRSSRDDTYGRDGEDRGRTTGQGNNALPARGAVPGRENTTGEQVGRELDQRDIPESGTRGNANIPADELGIDVARLFEQASEQTRMAICVTDPTVPGNPIVYVNQAFVTMTGYEREEAVGNNCKFLQGAETDPSDIRAIRAALDEQEVRVVEILNYRKDGTPFWNSLHIGPIYNDAGELTHYYGSQWDVTDLHAERAELIEERRRSAVRQQVAEELQHRTNNLFAVLTAIVRLSARGEDDARALEQRVTERIGAMARAHEASIAPGGVAGAPADLRVLAEAVLLPYRTVREHRVEFDGPNVVLPETAVTPLGLSLHELATNAVKYGALGVAEGRVEITWALEPGEHGDVLVLTWSETGGPVPASGSDRANGAGREGAGKGSGSRLVRGVLTAIEGSIVEEWLDTGLVATLRLPVHQVRDNVGLPDEYAGGPIKV